MDILKTSIDWAKAEMFSSSFFIIFGIIFISACIGFWQLGKTDLAKAYIIPTLVVGILLLIIGIGLVYNNYSRLNSFEDAYNNNSLAFIESEIARTENTLKEYKTVVFTAIPLIIVASAILIILINTPTWRAISITIIAFMSILLLVDGTAHARIEIYHKQLITATNNTKS